METKSISTYQAKVPITGTTGLLISLFPVKILNIEGNVNSTTASNYYLQLHGVSNPASGTAVPMYSVQVVLANQASQVNGFSFVYPDGLNTNQFTNPVLGTTASPTSATSLDGGNTNPVYAFISSTDGIFTSVAANTDLRVDIEDPNPTEISGQSIVSSLGSGALTVFTTPQTTGKKLLSISLTSTFGGTGQAVWFYLFAYDLAVSNSPALMAPFKFLFGVPTTYTFGEGLAPIQIVNGLTSTGCYLLISLSPNGYIATGSTAGAIVAKFK